jgi:GTP-binding protein HflX
MLVAVGPRRVQLEDSLNAMQELCRTAGVAVIDTMLQVRKDIDPRYLVGHGKLEEIVLAALDQDAEILIFDRELTATQSRSIGDATALKVLDRTQLILDIFAQHAKSEDGRLQVELAQLKYNQPRLSEMSTTMSRLTGGIGGRGPGETKLEINRRRAHERITMLQGRIEELSKRRGLRRQKRRESGQPVVAIVGYTNAGKSTLLNALTQSDVTAEDKLFATLDPASRRLFFAPGQAAIVADTVGFIRDLPEDLLNAFAATLEELKDADLLLHLIDASDPMRASRVASVEGILFDMGLNKKRRIRIWNKADAAEEAPLRTLRARGEVVISATERQGFDVLRERMYRELFPPDDA